MSSEKNQAKSIVNKMYSNDTFSKWLGIELLKIEVGKSVLQMTVRPEMLNGFEVAHGAICYAIADSALAFASNSHGQQSLSIETSISHTKKVLKGDVLTATAEELHLNTKTGVYQVQVKNQNNQLVALFNGTVYRTSKTW